MANCRLPTHPSPNESLGTASHERTAVHSGRTREPETLSRSLDEEDLVREILGESTLACSDGEDGLSFEEASKPRVTTEWGAAMASDLEAVTAAIQSRRTTLEDIRRKAEEQMIEPHSCGLAGEAQQNDMVEVFTDIHVKDEAKAVIEQANGSMQEVRAWFWSMNAPRIYLSRIPNTAVIRPALRLVNLFHSQRTCSRPRAVGES